MSKTKTTVKLAEWEAYVVLEIEYWQWIHEALIIMVDKGAWEPEHVQDVLDIANTIITQAQETVNVPDSEYEDGEYES